MKPPGSRPSATLNKAPPQPPRAQYSSTPDQQLRSTAQPPSLSGLPLSTNACFSPSAPAMSTSTPALLTAALTESNAASNILYALARRHASQHRRSPWWTRFGLLRRNVSRLCRLMGDARAAADAAAAAVAAQQRRKQRREEWERAQKRRKEGNGKGVMKGAVGLKRKHASGKGGVLGVKGIGGNGRGSAGGEGGNHGNVIMLQLDGLRCHGDDDHDTNSNNDSSQSRDKNDVMAAAMAAVAHTAQSESEARRRLHKQALWMRDVVVPRAYAGFGQLIASAEFSALALVLMACLARVHTVVVALTNALGDAENGEGECGEVENSRKRNEVDEGQRVRQRERKQDDKTEVIEHSEKLEEGSSLSGPRLLQKKESASKKRDSSKMADIRSRIKETVESMEEDASFGVAVSRDELKALNTAAESQPTSQSLANEPLEELQEPPHKKTRL